MQEYAVSLQDLRGFAKRLSTILVRSVRDSAGNRWADPVEVWRLGKLALKSIEIRRSLLDLRPGPKWKETEELRKMERAVWKIMSRVEKNPRRQSLELSSFSKDLKRITESYRSLRRFSPSRD